MKIQRWYPSRIAEQPEWNGNFVGKIPGYVTPLNLPTALVDAVVAGLNYHSYVVGAWLTPVRAFGPSATAAVDLLTTGTGPDPVVLPVLTVPALPVGVTAVVPGVLNRLFELVALIKASPGYTDQIGQNLRIIAPDTTLTTMEADHMSPGVKFDVVRGTGQEAVKIRFTKQGHAGVHIESKRGTGDWEFLAVDTESPYLDDRPLLVAGTPEVRQYRLRFWDKGLPNGEWTEVAVLTVGP